MKKVKTGLLTMASALLLVSAAASAQTVANTTSNGDLQVVNYSGKPPFKRKTVSPGDADFERYQTFEETVLVATSRPRRAGPPGKSLPVQQTRFDRVPEADISQFARFEETDSAGSARMFRGAPGKSRMRLVR